MKKKRKSPLYEVWRRLCKNRLATAGLVVLVLLILVAIFAPWLAPYEYMTQDGMLSFARPSAQHLLGNDRFGRDILSRLIYGTQASLQLGFISVAIAAVIGIPIGAIAGYYGKWVDYIVMRILDVYQAIPMMLLCLTLVAVLGPSLNNAILALGISTVPGYARIMRASVLTVREKEFIEAAKAIDASSFRIIFKHVMPNAISPLIIQITMGVGTCIMMGASLSFVGLGVQPPIPEWGSMVSEARNFLRQNPSLALYPGVCIMISVLSCNLLGDGLRDALDPRQKN